MVCPELSCFAWTVPRKMSRVQIQTVWSSQDQRQKLPCPRAQGKDSARWHARWTPSPSGSGSVRALQPGNFLRLPPPPTHPCWRSQTFRRLGDQGGHSAHGPLPRPTRSGSCKFMSQRNSKKCELKMSGSNMYQNSLLQDQKARICTSSVVAAREQIQTRN